MAGIEKICEITGCHCGPLMYKWKADLIQVHPAFLHLFRDKQAVLLFFAEPRLVHYIDDGPYPFWIFSLFTKCIFIPRFWARYYWLWRRFGQFYETPSDVWDYVLYVPDVPNRVDGEFWNSTKHPVKAVNNLSKLFNEPLNVVSWPDTEKNWCNAGYSLNSMFPEVKSS